MSPIPKKAIKFLLDENVNIKIATVLKQKGFDVVLVPKGLKNGRVMDLARKEERVLITQDTDFSYPALYPTEQIYSIIVLRIHPPVLNNLVQSLENFLSQDVDLVGKRFLLGESGYTEVE